MAKLNSNIIFSLKKDLTELHKIGLEMMNHTSGNCNIYSWRFPNHFVQDVDINVDNNLIHLSEKYIFLLELIIDRLYLIMNISVEIFNILPEMSNKAIFKLPRNVVKPYGLSFGTLVSFFWKRLNILMQSKDNELLTLKTSSSNCNSTICTSQTNFLSEICQSCSTAMEVIKNIINTLEECMNNLNLHCSITKQRQNIKENIFKLTQSEVMQKWRKSILIDIKCLSSFIKTHASEIYFLQGDLENAKQENATILKKLKIVQHKCAEFEKSNQDTNHKLQKLTESNNDIILKYDTLLSENDKFENNNKIKCREINELKNNIEQMIASHKIKIETIIEEYQIKINQLKEEKEHLIMLYDKTIIDIEKEKKNTTLCSEKCTKLENEINEIFIPEKIKTNNEKLEIEKENTKLREEMQNLKTLMQQQENEFKTQILSCKQEYVKLQDNLKTYKDRELLLLQCPDLNGPIVLSKGIQNPLQDMEQQVSANDTRIQLLQEQNNNLHRTIAKMKRICNVKEGEINNS